MGCDIHMWAEVLTNYNDTPRWNAVGSAFPYAYYREGEPSTVAFYKGDGDAPDETFEHNQVMTAHPYSGRNYNLFAILANVRNGHGFAGSDTGDGFVPMAEPRGVPDDATDFYKHQVEEWGGDGHSHSWATLGELKAYDWDRVTTLRGWISLDEYGEFRKDGTRPEWWSSMVGGGRIVHVNHEQANALLDGVTQRNPELSYYTRIEWTQPYREVVGSFLTETIPALEGIAAMEKVNDLRIVFFFDN